MTLQRRTVLRATALAPIAVASGARAATTDLVLACDTTLGPAMTDAAKVFAGRSGVQIHVFPTSPGLILPQLAREVQNDIVVTQVDLLRNAVKAGLVEPGADRGHWRNRLVLAAATGHQPAALTDGAVASSDLTPASGLDGPAVLARLGLRPALAMGALDTHEVAFQLVTGAARVGLVYLTDVRADTRLAVLAPVADSAYPPIVYAAAVTRLARRPNPDAFVTFLASPEATALLARHGLEAA